MSLHYLRFLGRTKSPWCRRPYLLTEGRASCYSSSIKNITTHRTRLDEFAREGARRMLVSALREKVAAAFVAPHTRLSEPDSVE